MKNVSVPSQLRDPCDKLKQGLFYIYVGKMKFAGAKKVAAVRENSNFFREELRKIGCQVLGDEDSPIMPIMLYIPAKIPAFSRECLKRNVCGRTKFS